MGFYPWTREFDGFKPKTVKTRIGALDLSVPQVREQGENGERFYPSALEKGLL